MNSKTDLAELAVIVSSEMSDAVQNFLMEQGARGVSVEKFDIEGQTETVRAYFSPERVTGQLTRSIETYLKDIEIYFSSPTPWKSSLRHLSDGDWQEKWKTFFRPIKVTRRIVVKPKWEPYDACDDEIAIAIDPGMAFGTGLHATTRLCLEIIDREIERRIKETSVPSLMDVGTGSGILAIAAARLGARHILGIDNDHRAIQAARRNVRDNGVECMVRISSKSLETISESFDLVLANIDFRTLAELKGPLADHLSSRGKLVVSGILSKEKASLRKAFQEERLLFDKGKDKEGWSCLVFERS